MTDQRNAKHGVDQNVTTSLEARFALPDLIIFCKCPVEVCERERPRSYRSSYPLDHLRKLDVRLQTWLAEAGTVPITG